MGWALNNFNPCRRFILFFWLRWNCESESSKSSLVGGIPISNFFYHLLAFLSGLTHESVISIVGMYISHPLIPHPSQSNRICTINYSNTLWSGKVGSRVSLKYIALPRAGNPRLPGTFSATWNLQWPYKFWECEERYPITLWNWVPWPLEVAYEYD